MDDHRFAQRKYRTTAHSVHATAISTYPERDTPSDTPADAASTVHPGSHRGRLIRTCRARADTAVHRRRQCMGPAGTVLLVQLDGLPPWGPMLHRSGQHRTGKQTSGLPDLPKPLGGRGLPEIARIVGPQSAMWIVHHGVIAVLSRKSAVELHISSRNSDHSTVEVHMPVRLAHSMAKCAVCAANGRRFFAPSGTTRRPKRDHQ